ncbi:uncharacterized protein LOC105945140 isoform X3 [Xenopus tropicalis]|uniref:Uncharacterized protein LOC105945140 isoform X3 n=1 Tax=Xenopus tropicalis TaxID=8364 RepID=A0A8J1J3W6_XENTR|nr:uncharacterized protein LOC105945140 isoform X3 [Xenopus tropicalis]
MNGANEHAQTQPKMSPSHWAGLSCEQRRWHSGAACGTLSVPGRGGFCIRIKEFMGFALLKVKDANGAKNTVLINE